MENQIWLNVVYTVKDGKRDEFYQKLINQGIIENSKAESGNLAYEYYQALNNTNQLLLVEAWMDENAQKLHLASEHYLKLSKLKAEYVTVVAIQKFKEFKECQK